MRSIRSLSVALCLAFGAAALAQPPAPAPVSKEDAGKAVACAAHGVNKSLCTRCNPKLAPVFKAKGDWCQEHERPETQCVLCHPELAKSGVK
jgi:hypothetical protein